MKILHKIIYTILVLPGTFIFWLLISFIASKNASSSTDYIQYGFASDLGRNATWAFPLSLLAGLIVIIIIWASGNKNQNGGNNNIAGEKNSTPTFNKGSNSSNASSGEYQGGNPYS